MFLLWYVQLRTGNIAHRRVKVETPIVVKGDVYDIINTLPPRNVYHNDLLLTHKLKKKTLGSGLGGTRWYVLTFPPSCS